MFIVMLKITRKSKISESIIKEDLISMRKYARRSILTTTIIVWLVLFFLNILIWIANHTHKFSKTIDSKLWMYFYIKDNPWNEDYTYSQILKLQKELDTNKIKNQFISKSQALKFFQKKLPNIISQFKKYDIWNPFPATLYVKISSDQDYQKLQQIIPKYANIISNSDDLDKSRNLYWQETRIIKTLNFSKFLVLGSYFLILLFTSIILFVLFYLFRILINKFYKKIEIKKLLWASFYQMAWPFLIIIASIIISWFIIMIILTFLLDLYLKTKDFSLIFFVDVFSLDIAPKSITWFILNSFWIIFFELVFFLWLSFILNTTYIARKIAKAWT